jgi:regulatory protein
LSPRSLHETAEQLAARYLARAPRTGAEVRARLQREGVTDDAAERAVAWLKERGWLDDGVAAESKARKLLRDGWAPGAVVAKLSALGVTDELARRAVAGVDERSLLRAALQRRTRGRAPHDARERAKLLRWLLGRGYSEESAREAVGAKDE